MRVLLIRLTALGDVILLEPVARALRTEQPGITIDLVTEARLVPLLDGAGVYDRVIGYDRRGADRGPAGLLRVLERVGDAEYDAVIDLQGKLRTRILSGRIKAGRRLVLKKRDVIGAIGALLGSDPPIHDRHAIELYLGALAPLGVFGRELDPPGPRLPKPATPLAKMGGALRIGLGIGTTHATKRWPPEHFRALAEGIAAARPEARFLAIGGAEDRPLLEAVRSAKVGFDPLDVAALDVTALAAEIAALDLLISVDSGPAHLAAAYGVPLLVLFGPTSWVRWGPRGGRARALSLELTCAPCSNIGGERCPLPDHSHPCMKELDVPRVLEAALGMLAG